MAVRATMLPILSAVRDLIGDAPADTAEREWTDEQIQRVLDTQARTDITLSDYRSLTPTYLSQVGGVVQWTDYWEPSGWGDWEAGASLYDGTLSLVTPSLSDLAVGHWQFADGQQPPVFIVGSTFDVYAAAWALVSQLLAQAWRAVDVGVGSLSLNLSQQRAGLQQLADTLASQMRVRPARLVRGDSWIWTP